MSVIDKFLNIMNLSSDDEDDFYDDDYGYEDDYDNDPTPVRKPSRKEKKAEKEAVHEETPVREKPSKSSTKVTPIRPVKRTGPNGMEVCVIKPTSVEDAREITETLLGNCTVVLNVEGLNVEVAQRIIDFTSGSCFAISGKLQKVSNYIFVITPAAVDISGDFLDLMDSFEGGLHTEI